jgi:hypothetical protein
MAIPTQDYHAVYLGPGLSADWLFVAAHDYCIRFQPIVTDSLDVLAFIPPRHKLAITSLARRDTAKRVALEVTKRYPQAYHDPLVYDYLEELQIALDGRAALRLRLGIPEVST